MSPSLTNGLPGNQYSKLLRRSSATRFIRWRRRLSSLPKKRKQKTNTPQISARSLVKAFLVTLKENDMRWRKWKTEELQTWLFLFHREHGLSLSFHSKTRSKK